ncbi:MAG: DUF4064 domain-containing protein [Methanobrevibacter sp.]|jgi:hypothetical protein|nr:DUF4064 domain-containing protein [Candidatus Methanovirga meridionalis]
MEDKEIEVSPTSRTVERILGILGGIFALGGGFFCILLSDLGSAMGETTGTMYIYVSFFVLLSSIIGIVSSALVKRDPKFYGSLNIVSGLIVFNGINIFGSGYIFLILQGCVTLLILSGILSIVRK